MSFTRLASFSLQLEVIFPHLLIVFVGLVNMIKRESNLYVNVRTKAVAYDSSSHLPLGNTHGSQSLAGIQGVGCCAGL